MEKNKVEHASDVLIKAMEMSDDLENVIVIYRRKAANPTPKGAFLGFIESDQMTLETANFMIDSYKHWLWSAMCADKENED